MWLICSPSFYELLSSGLSSLQQLNNLLEVIALESHKKDIKGLFSLKIISTSSMIIRYMEGTIKAFSTAVSKLFSFSTGSV